MKIKTQRVLGPVVPFHDYVAKELNWVLDHRPHESHRRALAAATNLLHVKCPKEHRTIIAAKFDRVMEHFGGIKKSKHFTPAERSIFYGAAKQLKVQDAADAIATGAVQGAGLAREPAPFGAGPDMPSQAPQHETHQPAAATG